MKVSIDRFEGAYAICEDDKCRLYAIEKGELPKDAREGSIIELSDDGSIVIDEEATKLRRERIKKLQDKLFHRKNIENKGDYIDGF